MTVTVSSINRAIHELEKGSLSPDSMNLIRIYIEELLKICPDQSLWNDYERIMYSYLKEG